MVGSSKADVIRSSTHFSVMATCTLPCFAWPPDSSYVWGSNHWKMTTWNKVHVSRHVYRMGFHVVQSDGDVVWFRDPMPYFSQYFNGPAHL